MWTSFWGVPYWCRIFQKDSRCKLSKAFSNQQIQHTVCCSTYMTVPLSVLVHVQIYGQHWIYKHLLFYLFLGSKLVISILFLLNFFFISYWLFQFEHKLKEVKILLLYSNFRISDEYYLQVYKKINAWIFRWWKVVDRIRNLFMMVYFFLVISKKKNYFQFEVSRGPTDGSGKGSLEDDVRKRLTDNVTQMVCWLPISEIIYLFHSMLSKNYFEIE